MFENVRGTGRTLRRLQKLKLFLKISLNISILYFE